MRARIAQDEQVAQAAWERVVSLNPAYGRGEQHIQGGAAPRLEGSRWSNNKRNLRLSGSVGLLVAQRLAFGVLVLLSIIFLTYLGLDMASGTALYPAAGEAARSTVSYLSQVMRGDLGLSHAGSVTRVPVPVSQMVSERVPRSLGLLACSLIIAAVTGISLGVLGAMYRRSRGALVLLIASITGMSVPSFFAALLLQLLVLRLMGVFHRAILPVGGFGWDAHLVLPAIVLAARPVAQIARITFVKLSEVLDEDFVRTAYSKGLTNRGVLFRHALRNTAIPILTTIAVSLRFSLSSLPVVEYFFAWPGVGFTLLKAISQQDDNSTVALLLILGVLFIVVNLLLEISYRFIDPRLRDQTPLHTEQSEWQSPTKWAKGVWNAVKELASDNPITEWIARRRNPPELSHVRRVREKAEAVVEVTEERKDRRSHGRLRNYVHNVPLIAGAIIVVGLLVVVIFGPMIAPASPYTTHGLERVDGKYLVPPFSPSKAFPWGSDPLGRDIMSLILVGAQQTLALAALVVAARLIVGLILGTVAGWFSGKLIDKLVQRIAEIISAFPMLLLAMMLILAIGIRQGVRPFVIALCFVGWGEIMQFVRGEMLTLRSQPFIESASAIAVRTPRIITRHILPHMTPSLIPIAAIEMGAVLMLLGELGFIGIFIGGGAFAELAFYVPPYHYSDVPEWGALLSNVRLYARSYPWVALYPSLAFFVAALGVNLLGEGLRRLVEKGLLQLRWLVNRYTLVALLVCALAFHFAQWETGSMLFYRKLANQFDGGRVMKQIETLTSPAFDERALGSQGMDQAADYIASQFSAYGLQAAGTNYTYFATHERTFESLDETPQLSIGDFAGDLRYLHDYAVYAGMYRNIGKIEGEVVFLAIGELTETVQGKVPALAGMDFSQKILLLPSRAAARAMEDLRVPIGGMLIIANDDTDLKRQVTLSGEDRNFYLTVVGMNTPHPDDYPKLLISKAVADRILASTGNTLPDLNRSVDGLGKDETIAIPTGVSASMKIEGSIHERMPVSDVIGYMPGTLAGEAISRQGLALDDHMIVVMAQYDSPPTSPDGTPFPGANDNATGVGIMLEAIRTMQESDYKPYKTFLFVAYSGEGAEGGNDVHEPDPSGFLRAAAFFSSAYKIEATVRLRGLGAGDGSGLALFSPGNLRLVHLFEDAAQRMGVRAQPVEDAVDMSVVFAGKTARDSGQESPDISLSWQGWEKTSRTPSDTTDTISQTKIEKAGRALALALMILGRETNY